MTTARKLEEPMVLEAAGEHDSMKRFFVFMSILAVVGAIVAMLRSRD